MIEYGFANIDFAVIVKNDENIDFVMVSQKRQTNNSKNHVTENDDFISLSQKSEKPLGRQAMIKQMEIGYQEMAEINLQIANE